MTALSSSLDDGYGHRKHQAGENLTALSEDCTIITHMSLEKIIMQLYYTLQRERSIILEKEFPD